MFESLRGHHYGRTLPGSSLSFKKASRDRHVSARVGTSDLLHRGHSTKRAIMAAYAVCFSEPLQYLLYCQWFFSTGSVHINPLLPELRVLLSNMDSIETVLVGVYPYISSAPWTGNPLASLSVRHVYSRLNEHRPSFLSRFLSCCIHCTFTRLGTLSILRWDLLPRLYIRALVARRLIRSSRRTEIFQPPQQGTVHAQLQLLGNIFQLFTPHLTSTHLTPDYINNIILYLLLVPFTAVNVRNKN